MNNFIAILGTATCGVGGLLLLIDLFTYGPASWVGQAIAGEPLTIFCIALWALCSLMLMSVDDLRPRS